MSLSVPEIPLSQVADIVRHVNMRGYDCIPNYLQPADLARAQKFVTDAVQNNGGEYVHFTGPASVTGSGLDELFSSDSFTRLIHQVYEMGTGKTADSAEMYQVLRCLSGSTGQKNSLIFHYDSYVVTALVPIHIPVRGMAGDLLMYPNTRKIRSNYMLNVVDKVLLDNPLTQWGLRTRVNASVMEPVRIKMRPGNLYLFWGYRSVHTNEPCDPDKLRATALFHYHNPHLKQTASPSGRS